MLLRRMQIYSLLESAAESETCLRVTGNFAHKLDEQTVRGFAGDCVATERTLEDQVYYSIG